MKNNTLKLGAIVALASLALAGCKEEVPFSSAPGDMAKAISSFGVSGHAVDGLIASGTVNVYDFSTGTKGKILGSGLTDSFGAFSTKIEGAKEEGQFLMACVESGSYTEEASDAQITLTDGDALCGVKLFDPSEDFN